MVIESTGDPRAGSYLDQRINLAIQRGNAASILGTVPRCGGFEDEVIFIIIKMFNDIYEKVNLRSSRSTLNHRSRLLSLICDNCRSPALERGGSML
ncbi:jg1547 [Pararge aegeria aegeria]|uniref:Jg1547 protein n=1 Tax=Pararge aegeria aegeria TaxID=348720 RepID=A0A8S4QDA4_9NEOP|nr:jg1547 [Pararge aegeria aegeria]